MRKGEVKTPTLQKTLEIIEEENVHTGSLVPILQRVQAEFGYLPKDVLMLVSRRAGVPISEILGTATFYAQFRFSPVGKYIVRVCHGTACHIAGASRLSESLTQTLKIQDNETTVDGLFTMERVACLGCCSLAPAVMINDQVYGRLTPEKLHKIIDSYKKEGDRDSEGH